MLAHIALGGIAEKVFERNKKPLEVKVFACYLYLHGPSFDQTSVLLGDLGLKVAKSAVWYWFQQVGAEIGELLVPSAVSKCITLEGVDSDGTDSGRTSKYVAKHAAAVNMATLMSDEHLSQILLHNPRFSVFFGSNFKRMPKTSTTKKSLLEILFLS